MTGAHGGRWTAAALAALLTPAAVVMLAAGSPDREPPRPAVQVRLVPDRPNPGMRVCWAVWPPAASRCTPRTPLDVPKEHG